MTCGGEVVTVVAEASIKSYGSSIVFLRAHVALLYHLCAEQSILHKQLKMSPVRKNGIFRNV